MLTDQKRIAPIVSSSPPAGWDAHGGTVARLSGILCDMT